MAYNTIATIKRYLALESADQTISDADLTSFLDEANAELFFLIKKKEERDIFRVGYTEHGTTQSKFRLALSPASSISKITQNGTVLDSGDYSLETTNKEEVEITASLAIADTIEIHYVPTAYEIAERYMCLMTCIQRMNPFLSDQNNNSIYSEYKAKRDLAIKIIKGKLHTGRYF